MSLRGRFLWRSEDRRRRSAFEKIYRDNSFGGVESRSGAGSEVDATEVVRTELPRLLKRLTIETLLDVPCGDFHWMQHVELGCRYIGADIVPEMISRNIDSYSKPGRTFVTLDMVRDRLPRADLILCRDGLVHLSFQDGLKALANFRRSGANYLLATTFLEPRPNEDRPTGLYWRPLNMTLSPYGLGQPIDIIREPAPPPFEDKSLGLWRLGDTRGHDAS